MMQVWNTIYAGERTRPPMQEEPDMRDKPEQVSKCLGCTLPVCVDCCGAGSHKYDRHALVGMIAAGEKTKAICAKLHVRPSTVERARREIEEAADYA